MTTHTITVDVPSVPYGPKHVATTVADADYYRSAANHIRSAAARGEAFAGSNLTETVAKLCDEVADKLSALPVPATPPVQLTADDFTMMFDADHTFSFTESEDGDIMAYGHPDKTALAAEITEYDLLCAGERYRNEIEPVEPDSIRRTYAVVVEGGPGDEWQIRWEQDASTPGAFPVSVVVR